MLNTYWRQWESAVQRRQRPPVSFHLSFHPHAQITVSPISFLQKKTQDLLIEWLSKCPFTTWCPASTGLKDTKQQHRNNARGPFNLKQSLRRRAALKIDRTTLTSHQSPHLSIRVSIQSANKCMQLGRGASLVLSIELMIINPPWLNKRVSKWEELMEFHVQNNNTLVWCDRACNVFSPWQTSRPSRRHFFVFYQENTSTKSKAVPAWHREAETF